VDDQRSGRGPVRQQRGKRHFGQPGLGHSPRARFRFCSGRCLRRGGLGSADDECDHAVADWASTVVFLTWSSYGGYYDHVAPPVVDVFGLGIRVPLVILSPYVKAGLVVHDQSEFSSLLAFAENVYGLAPLTSRDAAANNLMDAFDFRQEPLPPLILNPRQCLGSQ
jgi:hypothetical protein